METIEGYDKWKTGIPTQDDINDSGNKTLGAEFG
jgi:hypothetical protein